MFKVELHQEFIHILLNTQLISLETYQFLYLTI